MHKSVGAIIKNDKGEILLIERVRLPFGWAIPAGHVEDGEDWEAAIRREVLEEVGLTITENKLLFTDFLDWNKCSRGVVGHDFRVYEVLKWYGELKREEAEAKNAKWISLENLKNYQLEEATAYFFKKIGYN